MNKRFPISMKFDACEVEFLLGIEDNQADANTGYYYERNGYCEPEVAKLMARVVREGDRVIDVGANIGFLTLLLAKLVGPRGSVIAFEPSPVAFLKLRDNLRLNQIKYVSCMQQALSDKAKPAKLYMETDSGRSSLAQSPRSISGHALTTTTLDATVAYDSCRLIKLDAEGAEMDIAAGASKLFSPARCPYIVSELNEEALGYMGTSVQRFREWMRTLGYETFLLHEAGTLPTMLPWQTKLVGDRLNLNVLFSTVEAVGDAWPELTFAA